MLAFAQFQTAIPVWEEWTFLDLFSAHEISVKTTDFSVAINETDVSKQWSP
jgi:hypothetical protein